ncbi:NAD(P)-dependent oxidoreductase [Sphingosinicella sp. CPCC 101087]|uniref:NAD(P)-dependent oxidoreductase n=1 Tax=Sphingosinicella sp. CPCC 101087 TaxID=2497754 RepID=UPI00101B9E09|nr:NAD(P)-dependent oxidoreductase [Sphingosinicella sp. CPCC 101087]
MTDQSFPVAVLGLGLMGGGMARQLVARGFPVSIWNRTPERTRAPGLEGARVAETPADAVRDASLVIAMLATDEASRSVWLGSDGALSAMKGGAVAVESSTLTVDWVRALAAEMASRGVDFLDAPVTGSRDQAASGALKFLVGGDARVLSRARPVLDALGTEIEHLGPVGSGATLKLVNNFLCGVQAASLAEAVAMIERSGLDPARSLALLGAGAPGSPLVRAVGQRMLDRSYAPHFLVPLMAKDLTYAAAAFGAAGIDLASARAARDRYLAAGEAGFEQFDIASIVEPIRAAASNEGKA